MFISASVSWERPADGERRHPLAAGNRAMLNCYRFAVERISAAAESRCGGAAARSA
jgi:hypothetical protein